MEIWTNNLLFSKQWPSHLSYRSSRFFSLIYYLRILLQHLDVYFDSNIWAQYCMIINIFVHLYEKYKKNIRPFTNKNIKLYDTWTMKYTLQWIWDTGASIVVRCLTGYQRVMRSNPFQITNFIQTSFTGDVTSWTHKI